MNHCPSCIQFVDCEFLNRHTFYQKPEEVVVTIFAKGVPAKSVNVDYGEQIVCKICHTLMSC